MARWSDLAGLRLPVIEQFVARFWPATAFAMIERADLNAFT